MENFDSFKILINKFWELNECSGNQSFNQTVGKVEVGRAKFLICNKA